MSLNITFHPECDAGGAAGPALMTQVKDAIQRSDFSERSISGLKDKFLVKFMKKSSTKSLLVRQFGRYVNCSLFLILLCYTALNLFVKMFMCLRTCMNAMFMRDACFACLRATQTFRGRRDPRTDYADCASPGTLQCKRNSRTRSVDVRMLVKALFVNSCYVLCSP